MDFSSVIIRWYHTNKRHLPWRETSDPYIIWLSEVILQQTRVDQGLPYFRRFLASYPDVKSLADATEDDILKNWQGLGYYSRARNLHQAAKEIRDKLGGKFPADHKSILQLKGIGPYTAAAIASFAFNLPHPVIDGNVYRLLSRFFGIDTPTDSAAGKKLFAELAGELIDKSQPALYNQAIMEFGSLQCKPASPDCNSCPLNTGCVAFQKNLVSSLPVKSKKLKPVDRYFNYLVVVDRDRILLNKRASRDIWQNMYDFPLVESGQQLSTEELLKSEDFRAFFSNHEYAFRDEPVRLKHQLSHQTIYASFFRMEGPHSDFIMEESMQPEYLTRLSSYAIPRLIEKYLNFLVI